MATDELIQEREYRNREADKDVGRRGITCVRDDRKQCRIDRPLPRNDIEAQQHAHESNNYEHRPFSGNLDTDEALIVRWNSESDPHNPLNFSFRCRWTLILLASFGSLLTSTATSIFAPGIPNLMEEFGSTNTTLSSFLVTAFLIGMGIGPLWWAPLSELYGRLPVQHVGNVGFLCFTIMCARSSSLAMLVVARLLQGTFSMVSVTNGGGIIADTMKQDKRGFALSVYTMGILVGPSVGPVAGGFIVEAKDWRWSFWFIAILASALTITSLLVWRETYAPIILQHKAESLRRTTGNPSLRTLYDRGLSPLAYFICGIGRVCKMLYWSPIILLLSVHMGLLNSYFYILLTTLSTVFNSVYGWSAATTGLANLGVGIGFLVSVVIYANISDRLLNVMARNSERDELKPEYRLLLVIIGGLLTPVAFFWYGWSAQAKLHWMMPIIGTSFLGLGNNTVLMGIQSYVIDAYPLYAASGLAANAVVRSLMAAALPLAAPKIYDALDLGWGNSVLAFLALTMVPIPWLLMIYGDRLRRINKEKLDNM